MLAEHYRPQSLDLSSLARPSVLHTRILLSDLFYQDIPQTCKQLRNNYSKKEGVSAEKTPKPNPQKNRSILTESRKVSCLPHQQFAEYVTCEPRYCWSQESSTPNSNGVYSPQNLTKRLQVSGVSMSTTSHPLPNKVRASRAGGGRVVLSSSEGNAHCYLKNPDWHPRRQPPSKRSTIRSVKTPESSSLVSDKSDSSRIENWHDVLIKTTKRDVPGSRRESLNNKTAGSLKSTRYAKNSKSAGLLCDTQVKSILKSPSQCTLSLSSSRDLESTVDSYKLSSTKSPKHVKFKDAHSPKTEKQRNVDFSGDDNFSFDSSPDAPTPSVVKENVASDNSHDVNHINHVVHNETFEGNPDDPFPFDRDDGGFTPQSLLPKEELLFSNYDMERPPRKTKRSRKVSQTRDSRETIKDFKKGVRHGTKIRNNTVSGKNTELPTLVNTLPSEQLESNHGSHSTPCLNHITPDKSERGSFTATQCKTKSENCLTDNSQRNHKAISEHVPSKAWKPPRAMTADMVNTIVGSSKHRSPPTDHRNETSALKASLDCLPAFKIFEKRTRKSTRVLNSGLTSDDKTLRIIKWLYETDPMPQRTGTDHWMNKTGPCLGEGCR